ncbi:MAG: DUF6323 family protein [Hespellia sp.]|nr:DUF6323 family protein [Hespellia sp.]
MEQKNWMEQMMKETQLKQVLDTNQYTEKYGLVLSNEDTQILIAERGETLKQERRIEFGESILPKIIYAFCDSVWINQSDYRNTLIRLQDIFFSYKNEMMDEITDDELIAFMRDQFETVCGGDLDYLEGTCLDVFAQAIRAGYTDYQAADVREEAGKFDLVQRWDKELYQEVLRDLCWK